MKCRDRKQSFPKISLTNREKFKEVFGIDISIVGSMCHSNGMCGHFCDGCCQWWDKEYKDSGNELTELSDPFGDSRFGG
jgi:hypothetical protein